MPHKYKIMWYLLPIIVSFKVPVYKKRIKEGRLHTAKQRWWFERPRWRANHVLNRERVSRGFSLGRLERCCWRRNDMGWQSKWETKGYCFCSCNFTSAWYKSTCDCCLLIHPQKASEPVAAKARPARGIAQNSSVVKVLPQAWGDEA